MINLTRLFPVLAIVVSVVAINFPHLLSNMGSAIVPLLGLVMFGMGITLLPTDFMRVFRRPAIVLVGVSLQFILMPLIAWLISKSMDLSTVIMAGLVVVGACPGGTASNVICYLARGDVALSITLTTCSTIAAVLLTPLLTWLYIGQSVDVPVLSMMKDIMLVVICPVLLGVLCNRFAGQFFYRLKTIFPVVSMLTIILIIGIIMALNHEQLNRYVLPVAIAVILHNLLGLLCGYGIPAALGYDQRTCRTLAIEVGMQNSGLGVALASKYFSPVAGLPGALFSIWHNISGATLAALWAGKQEPLSKHT